MVVGQVKAEYRTNQAEVGRITCIIVRPPLFTTCEPQLSAPLSISEPHPGSARTLRDLCRFCSARVPDFRSQRCWQHLGPCLSGQKGLTTHKRPSHSITHFYPYRNTKNLRLFQNAQEILKTWYMVENNLNITNISLFYSYCGVVVVKSIFEQWTIPH